jgi:DNA-binding beta-propeller fold protein YncE
MIRLSGFRPKFFVIAASAAAFSSVLAAPESEADVVGATPLALETKIPLGDVEGRIDHMAIDARRGRLFVAELGNDKVAVVSLADRKVVGVIDHLKEPQGVGYLRTSDSLYIANAGDGSVGVYDGITFALRNQLDLKDDADNIRIDESANQIFVGYGGGGIAVIEAATGQQVGNIALKGHPEGFQLSSDGARILVNLPTLRQIAVIDRVAGQQVAQWNLRYRGNFPMALDEQNRRVLVGFRSPPRLSAYAMSDGAHWGTIETCGDTDDVFFDAKRGRVYVTCGEGMVDILESRDTGFARLARIPTAPGARTALFSPELDRLFVAVRASPVEPAGLWIFRPDP